MGLFDKVKNLFLEEEEQPEKTKKEEPKVEKKETKDIKKVESDKKAEEIISERDLFKADTTFKFPVMFEEDELVNEKEEKQHVNVLDFETTKIKNKVEKEAKKLFRPSPIISPVYGVLDKNYQVGDVVSKDEAEEEQKITTAEINIDDIRNKAYGTLEDELEQTLSDNDSMFYNLKETPKEEPEEPISLTDELMMADVTLEQASENYEDLKVSYDVDKVKKNKEAFEKEDVDEEHLFNLIDSMYEVEEEDK